jgi:hypothetical protein
VAEFIGYEAVIAAGVGETVPIGSIQPHPQNPRKHRIELIARSLQKFGQRSPLVVQRSTGYILKGNGTHAAAQMLGWQDIAVVFSDLEGDAATAYMLADNRPSDLASYERRKLRDTLAGLVAGPGLFDTLWGEDEFEDLDEEFRGVAPLPAKAGIDQEAAATAPTEGSKAPDPAKKMREVPFVFTASEHALFMEWMSQLKEAFGTTDWKSTIFECVKRQAALEADGVNRTGRVPPPPPEQVPGQVGMDDVLAEEPLTPAETAKDDDFDLPF